MTRNNQKSAVADRRVVAAAILLAVSTHVVRAGEPVLELQGGAYEVAVRLELPHLEDMGVSKTAVICVAGIDGSGDHGLVVLSENNPLGKCPASNFQQRGNTLTFDIACDGLNAAQAKATYALQPQGFQARIAMKMGGKNMTMTETQKGRRIGDCAGAGAPRS